MRCARLLIAVTASLVPPTVVGVVTIIVMVVLASLIPGRSKRTDGFHEDKAAAGPPRPFSAILDDCIESLMQEPEEITETLRLMQHVKHHGRLPEPGDRSWPTLSNPITPARTTGEDAR